ncbi:putative F-box protein [Dorcoceras hygrometricum]|uniref:Putative F-box protein n=1 Tax=Dorcoceras hygrometricum TaxID=472368 RepID=A0A2Z7CGV2_9LAMI|nr:putative F-box protein [Dorcoceras hygrometricum]
MPRCKMHCGQHSWWNTGGYTEDMFTALFQLPIEGLVTVTELPDRIVTQMKLEYSDSRVPVKRSCRKKAMKVEYWLLNDILAKALIAKVGSFYVVTQERFEMVAIMGGIKQNWNKILFGILKAMVDPTTKQARGFIVHLSLILEGVHGMQLGESKALPSLKILSIKSVGTYVAKNKPSPTDFLEEKKKIGEAVYQSRHKGSDPCAPKLKQLLTQHSVRKPAAPKRKLIVEEDSDSKDVVTLKKMLKASIGTATVSTSAPKTLAVQKPIQTIAESAQQSYTNLFLWRTFCRVFQMMHFHLCHYYQATDQDWVEPQREIIEVNWLIRSLPKITPDAKGKSVSGALVIVYVQEQRAIAAQAGTNSGEVAATAAAHGGGGGGARRRRRRRREKRGEGRLGYVVVGLGYESSSFKMCHLAGVYAPGCDRIHKESGTSRADEFTTDGISSTRLSEQVRSRQAAKGGAAAVRCCGEGGRGGQLGG